MPRDPAKIERKLKQVKTVQRGAFIAFLGCLLMCVMAALTIIISIQYHFGGYMDGLEAGVMSTLVVGVFGISLLFLRYCNKKLRKWEKRRERQSAKQAPMAQ